MGNEIAFKPAVRAAEYIKIGLAGPAGAGKTLGALKIAQGYGGRIAVLDTDRRARFYAGKDGLEFDVSEPDLLSLERVLELATQAEGHYDWLIIDNISAPWNQLLNEIDTTTRVRTGGDTRAAWREGSPRIKSFVDGILALKINTICTLRVDTEWLATGSGEEKTGYVAARVGLRPVQTKGIEYDFPTFIQLQTNHTALVLKDCSGLMQDRCITKLTPAVGREMLDSKLYVPPAPVEAVQLAKAA